MRPTIIRTNMTILQAHNIAYGLSTQLRHQFAEQLAAIHPDANICYHSHYSKFTVSVYNSTNIPTSLLYSTDFVDLFSHFEYSDAIEQLAFDITFYILEEQPCNVIEPLKTKTQTATEDN